MVQILTELVVGNESRGNGRPIIPVSGGRRVAFVINMGYEHFGRVSYGGLHVYTEHQLFHFYVILINGERMI